MITRDPEPKDQKLYSLFIVIIIIDGVLNDLTVYILSIIDGTIRIRIHDEYLTDQGRSIDRINGDLPYNNNRVSCVPF